MMIDMADIMYMVYDFPKHEYPCQTKASEIIKDSSPFTGSPIHKPPIKECCIMCGKSLYYCR